MGIWDFDDGDLLYGRSDDMAFDSDGHIMMRMSDNMAMDIDTGEMHLVSCWDEEQHTSLWDDEE